jgi:hypothetical protein
MQNLSKEPKVNPLAGLMRQPKLYIKLPSQGMFWPAGAIELAEEYAVYSMTAKDELMLKNPATQVGGQALVDVIQSCIPSIKNAWQAPGIDLDTILIAIRIATYGSVMQTPVTLENITEDYPVDLSAVLASILENTCWTDQLTLDNGMIIFLRPLPYKAIARAGSESSETQKIIDLVNNDKLNEEQKVAKFKESFVKITDLTLGAVADSISKIITVDNEVVENAVYIQEFMEQCDRDIFNAVRGRINELTVQNAIKPIQAKSTPRMQEMGFPEDIEVPVVFTPASFFQ